MVGSPIGAIIHMRSSRLTTTTTPSLLNFTIKLLLRIGQKSYPKLSQMRIR